MNDTLLRAQIRVIHRQIHKLRQRPPHPFGLELMKMYEASLTDLLFARAELKRIEARRPH